MTTVRILILLVVVVVSPWTWSLVKNPKAFVIQTDEWFKISRPARLDYMNTLRGESGGLGRWVVNKPVWFFKEGTTRILESFEVKYLIWEGDIDTRRSVRWVGPILPIMFPFLLWQLGKKPKWLVILVLASIPSVFIENHYHTTGKLGFLMVCDWLIAKGIAEAIHV